MLALGIRFLNGWSMAAADGSRKEQAEWPPHPDRVYSALAAAWFETDEDAAEGETLRWLESLPPPAVSFSDAYLRDSGVSYVPVNDTKQARRLPPGTDLKKLNIKKQREKLENAGLALVPEFRSRQPRRFPVAVPHDPTVYLLWPEADLGARKDALDRLASKVTHVGHSSSFAQVWVEEKGDIPPRWTPNGEGDARLRVPAPGRLASLAESYNGEELRAYAELKANVDSLKGKEKKKVQEEIARRFGGRVPVSQWPKMGRWQRYSLPGMKATDVPGTVFDPALVVLSLRSKGVSVRATLKLTLALRSVLMRECPIQPPPEWLSGHRPEGTRTTKPHIAYLALPFVGGRHADGRILGLALAVPKGLDPREVGQCLEPFLYDLGTGEPRKHRLFGNGFPDCAIELETRESPPFNLVPDTWTRPSRMWASVTPVVLNRHFDGPDKWTLAAESVKDACEHAGLPRPREVLLHPVSLVEGSPHSREFLLMERKDGTGRRNHNHAVLVFDEPVKGPVAVGAGRFRGYGLCRPLNGRGDGGG